MTKIEWVQNQDGTKGHTWNPTTGCTKISPGCKHCYAETMAKRLQAMGVKGYEKGFELKVHNERLMQPLKRKKATTYFVNSMSDLFHENVPDSFIEQVFEVIRQTPQHTYQILTKRAERMADFCNTQLVPENAWLGVSVEDKNYGLPRIDILRNIDVPIRFLSIEPLLEGLGAIDLSGIHWVIVGGESGPKARQMKLKWVTDIKNQCSQARVPLFIKQMGSYWARNHSKKGKGNDMSEWDKELKYFWAWAKVVIPQAKKRCGKIAYIDLFAGTGSYKDGTKSTPILVLERAIQDKDMQEMLVTIFNDVNLIHTQTLQNAINAIPNIETLKHKPQIINQEVGENIVNIFEDINLLPTLFFVDPWGYKGLSLRLINSVLKNWGCDCIFFFNYNRINMGLTNEIIKEHIDALFGEKRAEILRTKLNALSPSERELTIVEEITQALQDEKGKYVLPFILKLITRKCLLNLNVKAEL
ncbi:MAG: hypothetical protein B6247_01380 [Candidatus Parabeggiatoa sp. nov. 2]|nr:MAG: hypothetical protein B6247_01380 [Beggiatoa sp. 4572_84]